MDMATTSEKRAQNIGYACTGAHVDAGLGNRVAMRWISAELASNELSFSELDRRSNQFANVLGALGIRPGECIFTFLPRTPEQFYAFLGALKARVVVGTLFSNFGEDALLDRLGDARPRAVITKRSLARRIDRVRSQLPSLTHVILIDDDPLEEFGHLSFWSLLRAASDRFETPDTDPETRSVLHYTSGSIGKPKGVVHVHASLQHQRQTTANILGLNSDDVFWCTADQGWVTGTSYGIIGPWSLGITQLHYGGGYDAELWLRLLEEQRVTVWYTAPTALRMLMREPPELFRQFNLSHLRSVFSVGEPLNPEVIAWAQRVLDKDIHDTWFQTETGAIMIWNRPNLKIRPGSMGVPVPGVEAAILSDDGLTLPPGQPGDLCLRVGWSSMFRTYLNNESVYRSRFRGDWYVTGDKAYCDPEGHFWFIGRTDDVINTGGHLVSPFEVESALLELPEVAESGVVGVPDDILFEKVIAFVALRGNRTLTPALDLKMRLHVSNRVSSVATPQQIVAVPSVPKNKSGKIMRRILRARYLGQPEGDTSTLEENA